jgi:hypothetical protein
VRKIVSTLVDSHVHVHPGYEIQRFLDAAGRNTGAAATRLGFGSGVAGCLLFAESPRANAFARLRAAAEAGEAADAAGAGPDERLTGWSLERTAEPGSIVAHHPALPRLLIMAGRQIPTADRLEVLALLTTERFPETLDLPAAVSAARAAGAVPVIPWGFGKWSFRRGRIVARTVRAADQPLFLGDNGGRPRWSPTPRLLRQAERAGIPVLPGSDPLPLPGHETRAGSYGFVASFDASSPTPAADLRDWLLSLQHQPRTFGRRARLGPFVRDQVLMQLRRAFGGEQG